MFGVMFGGMETGLPPAVGKQTLLNTFPLEYMNPPPRGEKVNGPGAQPSP